MPGNSLLHFNNNVYEIFEDDIKKIVWASLFLGNKSISPKLVSKE
jgi:hypothetical protein